jgi:hypothetical protein
MTTPMQNIMQISSKWGDANKANWRKLSFVRVSDA